MDSIFDYIIIFAIIVSIYNALFGKKKQQKKVPQKSDDEALSDAKKNSSDFLEQIFGIPQQQKQPEYEPVNETEYNNSWDPEAEFDESPRKPEPDTHRATSINELKSLEKSVSKHEKVKLEIVRLSKLKKENYRRKEIIQNLKNPKTIRDYILVSEILNKPKALSD